MNVLDQTTLGTFEFAYISMVRPTTAHSAAR